MKQIAIKYIGRRNIFTDTLYGTGLTWEKGDVHHVPVKEAMLLLKHKDVFAKANMTFGAAIPGFAKTSASETDQEVDVDSTKQEKKENIDPVASEAAENARMAVRQMARKNTLAEFAKNNLGINLETDGKKLAELKDEVIRHIDMVGMPE